jgi:hypothetical protein
VNRGGFNDCKKGWKMTEEKIIGIIDRMDVFQVNKFSYRDEKVKKLLKKMVKDGILVKSHVTSSLLNYTKK